MDSTKSTAPEHHSSEAPEHRRVWRFLTVLLPSCAECGTQTADYFVRVPPGDLTYCADDELCESCAADHGAPGRRRSPCYRHAPREEERVFIELERLVYPEAAEEVECAMCERPFTLGLVIARALFWTNADGGEVCPECALWLAEGPMGASRPEAFPSLEDFAERLSEWEAPEYASSEEYEAAIRAAIDDDPGDE